MSTPANEIRRRIAAQERRRRQGLRGDPILRPHPDTPATRAPSRPAAGVPREGAMRPRPESGLVTGAGGVPDPFKGGAARPSPEPGLVTGSARQNAPNERAALRNALDAAGPNRRSDAPADEDAASRNALNAARPNLRSPDEGAALRNALDAAGPNRRSDAPADESAALQNAIDAGHAGQRATTQNRQVRDSRPVTLRDGYLTPEQTRAFPVPADSPAQSSGGDTVDASSARDLDGGSATEQTSSSAPRPSASASPPSDSGPNPNAAGARGPNDPGQFDAVKGLSPAQRELDTLELRTRRAAGETDSEELIGSAELAARTGGNPDGLRQGRGGSATFNIPQGAQLRSSSPGATVNRVEPVTGRTIVTGPDGIARFESKVLGGPLRERGGLRRSNAGPINTRLASGTGPNGEPVFDNASIRRGIEEEIIPEPVADAERAARNLALDEQRRMQTLRNQLNSGAITQEQFDTEVESRTRLGEAQLDAAADIAEAQAKARRSGSGADSTFKRHEQVVNGFFPEDGPQVQPGEIRLFRSEAEKAVNADQLPPDILNRPEDLGVLHALTKMLPELGSGIFKRAPNEPIGPGMAYQLAKRAVLNPGQDKIEVGASTLDTSKLEGRMASAFQAEVEHLRTSFNMKTAAELIENGFDPNKLEGETKRALEAEFERENSQRLAGLQAELKELRPPISPLRERTGGLGLTEEQEARTAAITAEIRDIQDRTIDEGFVEEFARKYNPFEEA